MAFSIQTNVNSLIAQENLRVNSNFQSQTIQRLTSGYRINSSGDDAAGLAIANKFRNDTAELTQGVRNANDGVAQLQIMDGGMNNIGKMLDRLKTLATQSASGTYTGDRSVLNSEYQTLVGEIGRQAQGIGLSTGGHFATQMGVYIGGGSSAAGTADISNGSVLLNLTNSVVDAKSLGLVTSDFEVTTAAGTDIGAGSRTSVANIITANSVDAGKATFNLSGPGFSGTAISVDITGFTKPQSVADAINTALGAAQNSSASFEAAGVQASIKTASNGAQSLVFSSNGSAFQVQAGTQTANALLGNFKTGIAITTGTGAAVSGIYTAPGALTTAAAKGTETNGTEAAVLRVTIDGVAHDLNVVITDGDTGGTTTGPNTLAADLTAATNAGTDTLAKLGVTFSNTSGSLVFTGPAGKSMSIAVAGDQNNSLGLGTWQKDFATKSYATGGGTAVLVAGTGELDISVNGGDKIAIALSDTSSQTTIVSDIQAALTNNATLKASGIAVATSGGGISLISGTTNFRVNIASATDPTFDLQLGAVANAIGTASMGSTAVLPTQNGRVDAAGSAQTGLGSTADVFSFKGLVNAGDQQTLSFSAVDSTGAEQSTSITLTSDTTKALTRGDSLDQAINNINAQLKTNATLQNIVAVKDVNSAGTAEGIRFISSLASFTVKVGDATNFTNAIPVGMYDGTAGAVSKQGMTVDSSASGSMDIRSSTGAQQALLVLGAAVQKLGSAQAAVGKGQNQLSYAISLANSQISNFSSAQAQIRDADVASEAANLSKAQVLQQASIAAMAQANSAPQAVLALLRG
jgi:flagellin